MPKTLIIFLLLIFLVTNFFGQKQSSKISKSKTQAKQAQMQVPKDWKFVNLRGFSFMLPQSMEDKKARGIDSQVWRFENSEMELTIDSGMYKVDFDYDAGRFENTAKWIEFNGVKGQYFSIDFTKPKSSEEKIETSQTEKEKPYLKAIMFYRSKYDFSSFWIRYKNPERGEIVEKILYSIKFKN